MEIYTLVLSCYATNTYVIIDNGGAIVVDPAENAEYILKFIADKHAEIKAVFITHGHLDHIGAAYGLQHNGATLYMTARDYELVVFDGEGSVFDAPPDVFKPDVEVNDGEEFEILGHKFSVVTTPGHTPGGACYVMDDSIIFSGDTLFRLSIGRTDFPFGSFSELKQSLKKLFALPHDYKVLSGHGEPTTLDFEREYNPYGN